MTTLSRLALGTAQFGLPYGVARAVERVSAAQASAILNEAWQLGVRTADTAMAYGDSEQVLGGHGMDGWQVVSKLPALPEDVTDASAWVRQSLAASLKRLRLPRLHALLLHRPQQLLQPRGAQLLAALRAVQADGLVAQIGVSIYDPDELAPLMDLHGFGLVQAPCSILDQRLHRSGWAERLQRAGVQIHARSAYLQGLLLSPEVQATRFAAWAPLWRTWRHWLDAAGLSPLQACIRHALALPHVDKVVLGVDSVAQLQATALAARGPATPAPAWPDFDARLLNPSLWTA